MESVERSSGNDEIERYYFFVSLVSLETSKYRISIEYLATFTYRYKMESE